MQFAISNDQLAIHYQLSISNELNRQWAIANASLIVNRQSVMDVKWL